MGKYFATRIKNDPVFMTIVKVDKTDWKRHGAPAVVNAYYSSIENSIQFPAGILQVKIT